MEPWNLFQFSIDNSFEIIMAYDDLGVVTYANKSAKELTEYGDELCGVLITNIYPTLFQTEESGSVTEPEDGKVYYEMAYRKNQTCFQTRVRFVACGEYKVCMAYDISNEYFLEKKLVQAELETVEALKVKSEFVANVTHELRTPVNGILGNTKELISREDDKGKLKLLGLIEHGCNDMNALINNILDFSKLEAGKFVLEKRKFDFRNMIDYVKGNHINRITEKGLEFLVSVSAEIPRMLIGDELRIVQILNNMISNAYKFTSVGEIRVDVVKTAHTSNKVELFFVVIDSGIGIAKADQDKLFKSFSQVDASISRKYGGTGLGLSICKELVELMDGSIHVHSDVGKGTVFSFNLWLEVAEEEYASIGNVEEEKSLAGGVNDDYEEQRLMQKLQNIMENSSQDKIKIFGEAENREEIDKKMTKAILSMEMDNWEKAEMFAEAIRQLVEDAPREIKSAALKLKMAVQKGDYDKAVTAYELLKGLL